MNSFLKKLCTVSAFFLVLILVTFVFAKKTEAANSPYLSGIAIYVEDTAGTSIPYATVTVTLQNSNPSPPFQCTYAEGKKSGTHTAVYDPALTGGVYLVDNVCCIVSGWTITVTKAGYLPQTVNVSNPWMTGQNRSTYLVNNGEYGWGLTIKLTPEVVYTCANNPPVEQCQQQPTSNKCLPDWSPIPGETCAPSAVCCRQNAPTATPTTKPPTATPTTGIPPTATATLPPGVPTATKTPPTATLPPGVPTATKTPPTATPTKVPPACGVECVRDSECSGDAARDGCTACLPTGPGGKKVCSKPPACGTPCDKDSDCSGAKDGCEVCLPNGSGTKVCAPTPTAEPTPRPYDDSMCKCDSLKYGAFVLGDTTRITAFGKVEGEDTSLAKITGFRFLFLQSDTGSSTGALPLKEERRDVVELTPSTPTLVRYQSDWDLALDPSLDTSKVYRIQARPFCSRKATAFFTPSQTTARTVLAVDDQPKSFIGRIIDFFLNLFKSGKKTTTDTIQPTPTLTDEQKVSLQMKTVLPATFVEEGKDENNCTFVRFNF